MMKLIYGLGVTLVGTGFIFGIFSIIAGVSSIAEDAAGALGAAIFFSVLSAGLIVGGMKLIRKAEPSNPGHVGFEDQLAAPATVRSIHDRFANFNISRLSLVGWLVLIASFVFPLMICSVVAWYPAGRVLVKNLQEHPGADWVLGVPIILASLGFYWLQKALLSKLGISIWRDQSKRYAGTRRN